MSDRVTTAQIRAEIAERHDCLISNKTTRNLVYYFARENAMKVSDVMTTHYLDALIEYALQQTYHFKIGCEGKSRHGSKKAAKSYAKKFRQKMRAYRCRHCSSFHLTHDKQGGEYMFMLTLKNVHKKVRIGEGRNN